MTIIKSKLRAVINDDGDIVYQNAIYETNAKPSQFGGFTHVELLHSDYWETEFTARLLKRVAKDYYTRIKNENGTELCARYYMNAEKNPKLVRHIGFKRI